MTNNRKIAMFEEDYTEYKNLIEGLGVQEQVTKLGTNKAQYFNLLDFSKEQITASEYSEKVTRVINELVQSTEGSSLNKEETYILKTGLKSFYEAGESPTPLLLVKQLTEMDNEQRSLSRLIEFLTKTFL